MTLWSIDIDTVYKANTVKEEKIFFFRLIEIQISSLDIEFFEDNTVSGYFLLPGSKMVVV